MASFFKGCVAIGGIYLVSKLFNKINPTLYSSYKTKAFIYGVKMYSKIQILLMKLKILTKPYYKKIKQFIWKKDLVNGPDSYLYFYKNNEIVDKFKMSFKHVIEKQLLPIEKDDSDELQYTFDYQNLVEYVKNFESSDYEYLVIENYNKKKADIIVRSKENAYDLEKIEYSKTEFLIIHLNIEDQNINFDLYNDCFNLNINGNTIDKNMVFLYNKYINNNFKFTSDYNIFIVDSQLEQLQLTNKDSVKLDQGKYIAKINDKVPTEESYEVINKHNP